MDEAMKRAAGTKRLRAAHQRAFARPELTQPGDGMPRVASTGGTSPMMKANDKETQRLIDEAVAKRREENTILGGG